MPFKQERSHGNNTFGTYNDIQGDQYNLVVYQSHTGRTLHQPSLPSGATPSYLHKHVLPPPPVLMIGRDKEKLDVIETLLHRSPPRVAILGGGGMGKTTLALSILNEDAISKKYPSRYFISCEGVLSISSLIEEIANALQVPLDKRDAFLIHTVFSTFPNATLLCLDNFETLWDDVAMRPEIEEFLSLLQHRVLGLIITMRGAQRPLKVSWSKPILLPLQPLTKNASRRIFEEMTKNSVDDFVEKLLSAVDGIPLAISLISSLLEEGFETSESLWNRWQTQSGVLEHGGKHRLSNLDTSIHLSVHGPQMDPTTIDILAMLSVLPDGLPDDDVEELQRFLPEAYDLRKALLTMQRVSLVQVMQVDRTAMCRRLQILSPIQSFCRRTLEGSEELRNSITSFYVKKMDDFADYSNPDGHAIIPSELHNVHAVLMEAWRGGKGDASIVVASIQFTLWSGYLGNAVEEVVRAAMQAVVSPDLLGNCHSVIGEAQLQQSKLDDAEASFKFAAALHRQAHSSLGEGNDFRVLGRVYLLQNRLDEAEASLERAIGLHQQAHDVVGEGIDVRELGRVYLYQFKLDKAEALLERAIEFHRQTHDALGEGQDLHMLGEMYLRQDKLDEAEASFQRAIALHRQAHSVLGEANDLQGLGGVYLRRHRLDEAEAVFKRAIELRQQAHDVFGVGSDLEMLGGVYLQRDKLDEAEASFQRAVEVHRQMHDTLGEGNGLHGLGRVYWRRDKPDKAEALLKRAIVLHRQAHDALGEGQDLKMLGELYLRQDKLDEAEAWIQRAVRLHRQAHSVLGEGNDLQMLGEVYLRQDKLDEAEAVLKRALEFHRQADDALGEGNDLEMLGGVHLRRDKLDEAEVLFKRAVKLHQQVHNVAAEEQDLWYLGKVHQRRSELAKAEASSRGDTKRTFPKKILALFSKSSRSK